MAAAFYTKYALDRFGAKVDDVVLFTAVLTGARVFAFLLVGWLGDRHGNRAALQVSTAAGMIAAALAWVAPELWWLYLVFAVNEVAVQGWGVCSMNYVLELCPPERSSTYTAVFGVFTGPFRVALPLFGGALAQMVGFGPVFGAAVVGAALTLLVLLYYVPEPRHAVGAHEITRPRQRAETLAEDGRSG
jgi:MFS family permease